MHSSKSHGKFKVQSAFDPDSDDDQIDQLIMKATTNSFTKKLSGQTKQPFQDLYSIIAFFSLSKLKPNHLDILDRKWFIVELDESIHSNSGIFNRISTCCKATNVETTLKPVSLPLYCLVLNMQNKQLHFQSLQNPDKHIFINFDTIPVQILQIQEENPQSREKISLIVQEYQINIYISSNVIPFPMSSTKSEEQKSKIAFSLKSSLEKILRVSILASRGLQLSLSSILKHQSQFIKKRFATEEQFFKYCDTGDILLFKDSHTMAKVQRFVLNTDYDHLAVVVKSQRYGICLFQSNSALGVALAIWHHLIRNHWFRHIEKISWRKLQVYNKSPNFDYQVNEFVKANLYKKYSFNVKKLLRFKSIIYSHDDRKRTYFCSELIATLYKYLGILDPNKPAAHYWPKNFSDEGHLNMIDSALDPERQLVFQDKLLKQTYPFYKP